MGQTKLMSWVKWWVDESRRREQIVRKVNVGEEEGRKGTVQRKESGNYVVCEVNISS